MTNQFNRNDGTFATVDWNDVTNTPSLGYVPLNPTTTGFTTGTGAFISDTTSLGNVLFSYFDIIFDNFIPGAPASQLILQVQGTTGVFFTGGYQGNISMIANGVSVVGTMGTIGIPCSGSGLVSGSSVISGISGYIRCFNPGDGGITPFTGMATWFNPSNQMQTAWFGGAYMTAGAITGVRLGFTTASLASGGIKIIGGT